MAGRRVLRGGSKFCCVSRIGEEVPAALRVVANVNVLPEVVAILVSVVGTASVMWRKDDAALAVRTVTPDVTRVCLPSGSVVGKTPTSTVGNALPAIPKAELSRMMEVISNASSTTGLANWKPEVVQWRKLSAMPVTGYAEEDEHAQRFQALKGEFESSAGLTV